MEGQELLQKAMYLKEQSEEAERQLQFCQQQIVELDQFSRTLEEKTGLRIGGADNEELR